MTEPTAKSLALAATSVRLLIHPGTPEQRCFWTCKANRPDHQENAVRGRLVSATPTRR